MTTRITNDHLKELDLICSLCDKILTKPTCLNECLHTYCESCLIEFSKKSSKCPQCNLDYSPTMENHFRSDAILDSILIRITGKNVKRKSREISPVSPSNRYTPIQILSSNTKSVSDSKNAPLSPISPQGIYLFGLEPAALISDQYLECPALDQPILKCKSDTTIRQIQKHIHRHLWPDLELDLDNINVFYNSKFLGQEWTMEWIARTLWKKRSDPLILNYILKKN